MKTIRVFWVMVFCLSITLPMAEAAAKWSITAGSGETRYGDKLLRSEIKVERQLWQLGSSQVSVMGQMDTELSAHQNDWLPELRAGIRLEQAHWGSEVQIGQNKQRLQTDWTFELLPRVSGKVGLRHDQTELQGFSGIELQLMPGVKVKADYLASSNLSYWLFGVGWE